MRTLQPEELTAIDNWFYYNARHLELALWAYHQYGGSREDTLAALARYQNADGGFGNAIEPDNWNPESSPYYTQFGIRILLGLDAATPGQPVMDGVLRFLEETAYSSENGWDFTIPSNDNYPRAPWWTYNAEANKIENIGLTATLSGFVLRYAGNTRPALREKALGYADQLLARFDATEHFGESGISGYCNLLEDIRVAGLADRYDMDALSAKAASLVGQSIMRDPEQWAQYTIRPSRYIHSPQSPFYAGNETVVNAELDYVLQTREPGGVWPLSWSWFDHTQMFPNEHAISENWSKAIVALETVQMLKVFGRLS